MLYYYLVYTKTDEMEMMDMKICGLQKTTLLDYPGHLSSTIFIGGCNFRCPFCHNSGLLDTNAEELYTPEAVLAFLKSRSTILEGVCITGGEPTLFPDDLEAFIRNIRQLGLLVKLDSNGYRPQVLKRLCEQRLVDYVAMDIKTSRERYSEVAGIKPVQIGNLEESVDFLIHGMISYEFRTTVVSQLHSAEDFTLIGQWIAGCTRYFLQNYVDSDQVLHRGFSGCTKEVLQSYASILRKTVSHVELRGIDL